MLMTTTRVRRRRNHHGSPFSRLLVSILKCCIVIYAVVTDDSTRTTSRHHNNIHVHAEYVPSYPYLFATDTDPNASYPIIEYLNIEDHLKPTSASDDPTTITANSDSALTAALTTPDFLNPNINHNSYRIVMYYLHWCATCRKFQPVYHKFGQKVYDLLSSTALQQQQQQQNHPTPPINLQIYAISCSPHRKLCQEQNVKGFPTIRFYRPSSFKNDDNNDDDDSTTTTVSATTTTTNDDYYYELPHHTHLHPIKSLALLGITFDGGNMDEYSDDDNEDDDEVENVRVMEKTTSFTTTTSIWHTMLSYWGFTSTTNNSNINN